MARDEVERLDPAAALAAFGRAVYSDLVSIVVLSVLFSLVSLPLVTIGAATIALVETLTDVVSGELEGGGVSERDRVVHFLETFRANVRRGLPLSVLLLAVVVVTGIYSTIALAARDASFLLGAVVGLYATVIAAALCLRTASLLVRAPADRRPAMRAALHDAAYHLLETPSFSVLVLVFASVLIALCVALQVAVVLLLPGLLGLLEVVSFEETSGEGARRVVLAYRGDPS
ncbi:YesL family protein [Halomarina pelagica]|uniref:YesL family protein n=1 Tax=Halomarina pelagica TaxID=2961599 RepID=UPI0020C33C0E|nr:YesL family protein [Halomarina sp. BND7]